MNFGTPAYMRPIYGAPPEKPSVGTMVIGAVSLAAMLGLTVMLGSAAYQIVRKGGLR